MLNVFGTEPDRAHAVVEEARRLLDALWGKSAATAGGSTNLLICHMLDTAAVAERIWDDYLALGLSRRLDRMTGGHGRRFFVWLCAIHDLGKASPGFQSCVESEAKRPQQAGLTWDTSYFTARDWRHDRLGAVLVHTLLQDAGWSRRQIAWVWPMVAGHHGRFPSAGDLPSATGARENLGWGDALPSWELAQRALLETVTGSIGFAGLGEVEPVEVPSRGDQLTLAGFVIMADWIASNSTYFTGIDSLENISMDTSRTRAATAWRELGLRGGWGRLDLPDPEMDLLRFRFGQPARGCQGPLVELGHAVPEPALFLVEAPMGEGKTRGGLALAEVLASRFGCDGVLVAMPTQATCTPMYDQVTAWVAAFSPDLVAQVQLLHGKRRFNRLWQRLWQRRAGAARIDEYGVDQDDCSAAGTRHQGADQLAWFLGAKRGLLTAFGIATFDQLLFAATRTKHVMLRFAGLAGKVVVIDEVHAADVYMRQFLFEALRLLGSAKVPVVLMSATLPPSIRQSLCDAYAEGATGRPVDVELPAADGYPQLTAVWGSSDGARAIVRTAPPWRQDLQVAIEVMEDLDADGERVARRIEVELCDGGTALIVVNWVERAQRIYEQLKDKFDGETLLLLHGRLNDADRAERTGQCLAAGKGGVGRDPRAKRIIVATQIAEQSFNIDADLLVTDIAPIDLLLQRVGRLHRNPETPRPLRLRAPKVIITGLCWGPGAPEIQRASSFIYGALPLLKSAAIIHTALQATHDDAATWSIPSQVPALVATGYDGPLTFPDSWTQALNRAAAAWETEQAERAAAAEPLVLTPRLDRGEATLAGLHRRPVEPGSGRSHADDEEIRAVVRDGEPSVEVIMVRSSPTGYATIDGSPLGPNGEAGDEVLERLLGGTVRLPPKYTQSATSTLASMPGWEGHPWLQYAKALVLDGQGTAALGDTILRYDSEYGLRERKSRPSKGAASPAPAGTTPQTSAAQSNLRAGEE